jgi:uncharacterized protein YcfL
MKIKNLKRLFVSLFLALPLLNGCATQTAAFWVRFLNYNGGLLQQFSAEPGAIVKYTGKTPEKANSDDKGYVFSGWDPNPEHTPIEADTDFTAQFAEADLQFHVYWYDGAGELINKETNLFT